MTARSRTRCGLLVFFVLLGAAAIGARLYQLQIQHCDRFRARAADQHRREVVVQATRGAILDRTGRDLAVSLKTQSLFAHPWRVEDPELAAAMLARAIDVPRATLLRRLRSEKPFVYLRRALSPEQVEAVQALELPVGPNHPFGFSPEPRRFYPHGERAVHVIGFANVDGVGVEGIERQYDDVLQGDPTVFLAQRDARNGQLLQRVRDPERKSHSVVLSLDLALQHIAERELDRAMSDTGARAATAVLLDPTSGEVLALANRPTADLASYGRSTSNQRTNRAVVHYFEPGSTFKIVTMAAVLERGRVGSNQHINCENGSYTVGGRTIHDTSRNGYLTPREILARSSNIGMVKMVRTLQSTELHATMQRFGFGHDTGIELPGESAGMVRDVAKWSGQSQDSIAFGQEIGVTALQLASAIGAVANDGVLMPPRIVLGTMGPDGRVERQRAPAGRRVVSSEVARQLREMLEGAVTSGTGSRAADSGYRLAGKTGTAQIAVAGSGYSDTEYMASFGGLGPTRAPRLACLVVLDSPRGDRHQGGQVAAPVFSRIMVDALRYLRVPAESAVRPPVLLTAARVESARRIAIERNAARGTVPDVRGLALRDAVTALARHGYRAQIDGEGVVASQRPAPGAPLDADKPCRLQLRPARPLPSASDGARRTGG